MATGRRALEAALFMRRCRQPMLCSRSIKSVRFASDAPSPYAPANFSKPLRQPPRSASSTPTDTPREEQSIWDRPLQLPASWHHSPARSVQLPPPHVKLSGWGWIRTRFGFPPSFPAKPTAPFHIHNNPYRARKKWPPDIKALHPKQQFHFEKTYRRRAKLKWARPSFHRWTKLLQNTLLISVTLYFVFILEPSHGEGTPFDGFRVWFFRKMRRIAGISNETREEVERLEEDAREQARLRKEKGLFEWLKIRYPG